MKPRKTAQPHKPRSESSISGGNDKQIGIDSIETGMQLLLAFVNLGGRTHQLKVLAEAAGMPPSKAHRYLVSLIRMGFVGRDELTGHYRLGPRSIELGATAVHAMDSVSLSIEAMIKLHDELDHTMTLSVWGTQSPVILRVEEADQLVTVTFRVGKSLPLLTSAAGLLFSAFLPRQVVEPLIQAEVRSNRERRGDKLIRSMAEADRLVTEVRARRLARITGDITPGINAMAAPVFDSRGYPAAVISAIGPAGSFDSSWTGTVATALRRQCEEVSRQLGFAALATARQHASKDPA